ncbi:MAG: restriction endonuclease subunit S [Candidatus Erginobacter occultus]|nr:restriction endonuclease subunit S [Candidatus Erginobacter occultus]
MTIKQTSLNSYVEINPEGITKSYPHDLIEYIDISSVGTGCLVDFPKPMKLSEAPSRAKRIVRNGDTILSTVRPNLRSFLYVTNANSNTIASTGFAVLRAKQNADPRFVYYAVTEPRFTGYLTNNTKGTSYPAVDSDTILRGEVPEFQLERQRRISATLSCYDDLIENNRRRIQLLEEAARLLYKEWFVHLRFPGHEHVKITDGVPEGWEKKNLFDVWDISYGKNLPTKIIAQTGKYPVHGADRIIGYYSQKNVNQSLCLITCRGAGIGNVRRTFGPTFVTNNCFVLRPRYLPRHLRFHFAMLAMEQLNLYELRTGAAQPQLTLAGINHLSVVVPTLAILDFYNSFVDPLYLQADCLRWQEVQLAKARDLLLPRLMNGEVAV